MAGFPVAVQQPPVFYWLVKPVQNPSAISETLKSSFSPAVMKSSHCSFKTTLDVTTSFPLGCCSKQEVAGGKFLGVAVTLLRLQL